MVVVSEFGAARDGCEFATPVDPDAAWRDHGSLRSVERVEWDGRWPGVELRRVGKDTDGSPLAPMDLMYLSGGLLCGRTSCLPVLEDLLVPFGTVLPVTVQDAVDLFLFRPKFLSGAMDEERSSFVRFPNSTSVMIIQDAVFREEIVQGVPIFASDARRCADPYVTNAFVERLVRTKLRVGMEILDVWRSPPA